MELSDAIGRRRMARSFTTEPLAPSLLERVLDLALRAPSAGFAQGVDLLVLEEQAARARFWELATDRRWREEGGRASGLLAAPVVALAIADPDAYVRRYAEPDKAGSGLAGVPAEAWDVPYWLVDASFVVMQLLLAATDAGLGALLFRLHAPAATVLGGLGVPAGRACAGAVVLGHRGGDDPPTSPSTRARRPPGDAVHIDRW